MFRTDNQQEMNDALILLHTDNGSAFTAGYATGLVVEMLNLLPKRKQKEFLKQVQEYNDSHYVTVKNVLSGRDVQIQRGDVGGPCDPSMERYHSM